MSLLTDNFLDMKNLATLFRQRQFNHWFFYRGGFPFGTKFNGSDTLIHSRVKITSTVSITVLYIALCTLYNYTFWSEPMPPKGKDAGIADGYHIDLAIIILKRAPHTVEYPRLSIPNDRDLYGINQYSITLPWRMEFIGSRSQQIGYIPFKKVKGLKRMSYHIWLIYLA